METLTHCPICSGELPAGEPDFEVSGWTIVTCPHCGVGLTNPRPTLAEIGQYYRASFFSIRPDVRLLPAVRDLFARKLKPSAFVSTLKSIVLREIKYRHDWTLQGNRLRRSLLAPLRWLLALTYEPVQSLPGNPARSSTLGLVAENFC